MALINPNNTNINKTNPSDIILPGNIRFWGKKTNTAPNNIQAVPSNGGISLTSWIQYALDQGFISVSGTEQLVTNAGALAGVAPDGAVLGIDTTSGNLYYVSGGNWAAVPSGGAPSINFQTIANTTASLTGNYVLLDSSSSTATLQLAASPTAGTQFYIKAIDVSNGCVIDGNGNDIEQSSSDYTLTRINESILFTYNSTYGWLGV